MIVGFEYLWAWSLTICRYYCTVFPGRASVVMDSGVDGWQGVTGKLFINHYDLIVEVRTGISSKVIYVC